MKKILLVSISITLFACSGTKKVEKALNTGNYDEAINRAIGKLRTNKDKKGKQPYIVMLETAFAKVSERDKNQVAFLEKENNPANLDRIYKSYKKLKSRQERIKPLLPLYIDNKGRNAKFTFENYDNKILATKERLSSYLYKNADDLLNNAKSKYDYRDVYEDLTYLSQINPGYKNSAEMMEEAHFKGTDFVMVSMKNKSNVIIPKRLEEDLLNFNTYGLDNLWTVYHGTPQKSINYDYAMQLDIREINISPEQVREKQFEREKQVADGWEYATDDEGKILVDGDGNKVKKDKLVTVVCEYYEFTQFKAVNVVGNVRYRNLKTKQTLDNFPLASEYVFEHRYANYNGDKRALDDDLVRYLGLQAVRFPTNEQMVYDSGEDLKNKLKGIITRYRFQ